MIAADMAERSRRASERPQAAFHEEASLARAGFLREFYGFLVHRKKWWLVPVIVVLLLVGAVVLLAGTAAGPLIYTLF